MSFRKNIAWLGMMLAHLPLVFDMGLSINFLLFPWVYPLFAMICKDGYHYTKSLSSYVFRLVFWASISQPFFMIYFATPWYLTNALFGLAGGVVAYHYTLPVKNRKTWDEVRLKSVFKLTYAIYPLHFIALTILRDVVRT